MSDLRHLSDDDRLRLALLVPVLVVGLAGTVAAALGGFGSESGARVGLGIALAACFPLLVGTTRLSRARRS